MSARSSPRWQVAYGPPKTTFGSETMLPEILIEICGVGCDATCQNRRAWLDFSRMFKNAKHSRDCQRSPEDTRACWQSRSMLIDAGQSTLTTYKQEIRGSSLRLPPSVLIVIALSNCAFQLVGRSCFASLRAITRLAILKYGPSTRRTHVG